MSRELLKRALDELDIDRDTYGTLCKEIETYLAQPEPKPTDKAKTGIYQKFVVVRVDGKDEPGGKHHDCEYFVMDLDHDKHAPAAMAAYAQSCKDEYPVLSSEILARFPSPPDQSARIAELERALMVANADIESLEDRLIFKNQRIYEYNEKLAALQAKREPLSDDEIRDCAESENLPYFENKEEFDAFARAIEAAHGIGVNHE